MTSRYHMAALSCLALLSCIASVVPMLRTGSSVRAASSLADPSFEQNRSGVGGFSFEELQLYHTLEGRAHSTVKLSDHEYVAILGVETSNKKPQFKQRRMDTRETWVKFAADKGLTSDALVLFYDGRLSSMELTSARQYIAEYAEFGDLAFTDGDDDVLNPRHGGVHKQLSWYRYAFNHYKFRYAIKLDDDCFVHMPNLLLYLGGLPATNVYAGRAMHHYGRRDLKSPTDGRQRVPCGEYMAAMGALVVMSFDVVRWIAEEAWFPHWLDTVNGITEDWFTGCVLSYRPNTTFTALAGGKLAGAASWLTGDLRGFAEILAIHFAGHMKNRLNMVSTGEWYRLLYTLYGQYENSSRQGGDGAVRPCWNQSLFAEFAQRPQFLTVLASLYDLPSMCEDKASPSCKTLHARHDVFLEKIDNLNAPRNKSKQGASACRSR
mmetsp:Transcript_87965/g.247157  ORF Transcript_87965/g.247157 Transcript_87965/m.247157 type:complete len:435 (-) Transcript_87965:173-1477(-)